MVNSLTWLLIADASKARLYGLHKARVFKNQHPEELKLLAEFSHEKSRKKDLELVSDRQGEFGSGTFVENTSPKAHEALQFAHQLLAELETGRKEGSFRDLIIVAPPAFMGLLKKHMPEAMHKVVSQSIEKDYTQQTPLELMKNLIAHF